MTVKLYFLLLLLIPVSFSNNSQQDGTKNIDKKKMITIIVLHFNFPVNLERFNTSGLMAPHALCHTVGMELYVVLRTQEPPAQDPFLLAYCPSSHTHFWL